VGVSTQITSSASARSSSTWSAAATGTARITRPAPRARATWQAARAVEPVATPSSMISAVRPASATAGWSPRSRSARWVRTACSLASTAASCSALTSASCITGGFRIRTPPSPMAPMPSSGRSGTPSLRTTITSRGAWSVSATSNATATPPRGSPSTATSCPRRWLTRRASCRPASIRSANVMVIPLCTRLARSHQHDRARPPMSGA
jgi:hypothetical protein